MCVDITKRWACCHECLVTTQRCLDPDFETCVLTEEVIQLDLDCKPCQNLLIQSVEPQEWRAGLDDGDWYKTRIYACGHQDGASTQICLNQVTEIFEQGQNVIQLDTDCTYCQNLEGGTFSTMDRSEYKRRRFYSCGHTYSSAPQNISPKSYAYCLANLGIELEWPCHYCQHIAEHTEVWRIEAGRINVLPRSRKIRLFFNSKRTAERWPWGKNKQPWEWWGPIGLPFNRYHELFLKGAQLPRRRRQAHPFDGDDGRPSFVLR
jgi:hypothetical protein